MRHNEVQKKKKEEKFPKGFVDSFSPVENVSGTNLNVPIHIPKVKNLAN